MCGKHWFLLCRTHSSEVSPIQAALRRASREHSILKPWSKNVTVCNHAVFAVIRYAPRSMFQHVRISDIVQPRAGSTQRFFLVPSKCRLLSIDAQSSSVGSWFCSWGVGGFSRFDTTVFFTLTVQANRPERCEKLPRI